MKDELEKFTEQITFRLSKEQKKIFEEIKKREGIDTYSALLRTFLRTA
jgi:protease II